MNKANPATIGAFVLGAVSLVVVALIFLSSSQFFTEKLEYVLFFDGSIKGLTIGATVDCLGVHVGSVTDIVVEYDVETSSVRIPVYVKIEPGRIRRVVGHTISDIDSRQSMQLLVERGMRAQLKMQSLVTGQLFVELNFHQNSPINLHDIDKEVPEMPTVSASGFDQITSSASDLIESLGQLPLKELFVNLVAITQGLNQFANGPEFKETFAALNRLLHGGESLLQGIDERVNPLTASAESTLTAMRSTLQDIQTRIQKAPIDRTFTNVQAVMQDIQTLVRHLNGRVEPVATSLASSSSAARGAFQQAKDTLAMVETMVGEESRLYVDLTSTLKESSGAARAIRLLAEYLERNPSALIMGKRGPTGR